MFLATKESGLPGDRHPDATRVDFSACLGGASAHLTEAPPNSLSDSLSWMGNELVVHGSRPGRDTRWTAGTRHRDWLRTGTVRQSTVGQPEGGWQC
jgi:hypothetical protein